MHDPLSRPIETLEASYATEVCAADIATFAALSGDDYEAHCDPQAIATSSFGGIVAHGALLVGYMSAAGTKAIRTARSRGNTTTPVSLGYDRIRLIDPVCPGDRLTVTNSVRDVDCERARSVAAIEVVNQSGDVDAVAQDVMKWLPT